MECTDNSDQFSDAPHEVKNCTMSEQMDYEGEDKESNKEHIMFSSRSISVTASSIGISSVSEEVCQHIAGELYYKTKELINMAKLIVTQNKKSTLTTKDIKKAMDLLGGVEIYGQNSVKPVNFVPIPEADVYVEEDPEIEILEDQISDSIYSIKKEPFIHGGWIMPEGYFQDPSITTSCTYFQKIAKTILSGSPAHLRVALSDLRTNPKVGPVCPYFLNLVALTVNNVHRDIHLTNALIGTVHAIAHNKFVDASPYLAANRAVNSLLKIVIEGNVKKIGDDYVDIDDDLTVRMRAGILLAKVVTMWSIQFKQQYDIVRLLLKHLVNPAVPLQSHYGAIVALTTLGQRRLDYFWPIVEKFLALLEGKIEGGKNNIMVRHVMTAILVAARNTFKKEEASNPEQLKRLYKVDKMLYYSFGDSITPLRLVATPPIFKCEDSKLQPSRLKLKICGIRSKNTMSFGDPCNQLFQNSSNMNLGDTSFQPYFCVKRNYKFCQPQHIKSASGDLLLIL